MVAVFSVREFVSARAGDRWQVFLIGPVTLGPTYLSIWLTPCGSLPYVFSSPNSCLCPSIAR